MRATAPLSLATTVERQAAFHRSVLTATAGALALAAALWSAAPAGAQEDRKSVV